MSETHTEAMRQDGPKASYINIEYTDEQVREYYESILKSTDLYPVEMYEKIQALFATNMPLEDKAVRLSKIYEEYGNAEYQAAVLLKTVHRGENGMSFYFGDGYTHIPWHTIANIIRMLITEGEYTSPIPEESLADKIGDFNIPDEIDEMHISDRDASHIAHKKEEDSEEDLYACRCILHRGTA